MKPPTLLEVARVAGVSTATVARVLRADGYVSDSARERVEAAVRATGYRPNAMARGLRQQRSLTIGHMVTAITINPFFANVARWAEEEALEHGYKSFLFHHNGEATRERVGVERFIERRVDAVLFTNAVAADNVYLLQDNFIPAVQIERVRTVRAAAVRVDNRVGAVEAMRHLFALGHRRIGFVGGDHDLVSPDETLFPSVEAERFAAYADSLRAAGLPVDPALVRLGLYYDIAEGGSGIEGYRRARELLALPQPPTAIFATCDILAAGVLQALGERDLRVPRDLSVVGFDDTLAVNLSPALTTVAQPMEALGRAGFRAALAAIRGEAPALLDPLPTRLVVRRSTGPAPRVP